MAHRYIISKIKLKLLDSGNGLIEQRLNDNIGSVTTQHDVNFSKLSTLLDEGILIYFYVEVSYCFRISSQLSVAICISWSWWLQCSNSPWVCQLPVWVGRVISARSLLMLDAGTVPPAQRAQQLLRTRLSRRSRRPPLLYRLDVGGRRGQQRRRLGGARVRRCRC